MAEPLPFRSSMTFAYGEPRELSPGVARIVANNPNHFTFKGTNTYLVGTRTLALIDPGPEDPDHLAAILKAIGGRPISHVLITHTHRDHTDGMPALLAATGARTVGFGRRAPNRGTRRTSPSGGEFVDQDFVPDIPLADDGRIEGDGWAFAAVHTPGHARGHLCFYDEEMGFLLTSDNVVGAGTVVIAPPEGDMTDYLNSLERMKNLPDLRHLCGSHGAAVFDARNKIEEYIAHRLEREKQILEAIETGAKSAEEIARIVYQNLNPPLFPLAVKSVEAHLAKIEKDRASKLCETP